MPAPSPGLRALTAIDRHLLPARHGDRGGRPVVGSPGPPAELPTVELRVSPPRHALAGEQGVLAAIRAVAPPLVRAGHAEPPAVRRVRSGGPGRVRNPVHLVRAAPGAGRCIPGGLPGGPGRSGGRARGLPGGLGPPGKGRDRPRSGPVDCPRPSGAGEPNRLAGPQPAPPTGERRYSRTPPTSSGEASKGANSFGQGPLRPLTTTTASTPLSWRKARSSASAPGMSSPV